MAPLSHDVDAAWRAFTTPAACPLTARERRVMERAEVERTELAAGDGAVDVFTWRHASEPPRVLFAHGWGGRAGQFAPLVLALLERRIGSVAFDAPAHGRARDARPENAPRSNVYAFQHALARVAAGQPSLRAIVGHSLGAAAALMTHAREHRFERLALVAPIVGLADEVGKFARRGEVSQRVEQALRARIEAELDTRVWDATDTARLARADGGRVPTLVVHDVDDPRVEHAASAALAKIHDGMTLHSTRGLGHVSLLRDGGVVEAIADFVAAAEGEHVSH